MSSSGGCRHFAVWLTPECRNCSREINVLAFAYVNSGALWRDLQILTNPPTYITVCTLIFISLKMYKETKIYFRHLKVLALTFGFITSLELFLNQHRMN